MEINGEELYPTGAFAKLCGVKKQTLFHYDDIGLLKPAHTDEKGYRWYSYGQYQDFLLISCLKEAGMSLAEIRDYLYESDAEAKERAMRVRIAALDSRISYLMHVRKVLSSQFASEGGVLGTAKGNPDIIKLVDRPALEMWASKRLDKLDDKELVEHVAAIVQKAQPFAVALARSDVQAGVFDNQCLILIDKKDLGADEAAKLGLTTFTRPEGKYGVTTQQPGEAPRDAYGRLLDSMELFGEEPGEFFYEEYPTDEESLSTPLVMAVQFIRKL